MNDDKNTGALHGISGSDGDGSRFVERLIEAAGPGPEIPRDGVEKTKAALRPEWRQLVAARRRRRRTTIAAMATAAVVILAIGIIATRQNPAPVVGAPYRLTRVVGAVEIVSPDRSVRTLGSANEGAVVESGSQISTTNGAVLLETGGGLTVRLDRDTRAELASTTLIALEVGAVYIDTSSPIASAIEIRTAMGSVFDIGTRFQVRCTDTTLTVEVRDGLVRLDRDDRSHEITVGNGLTVTADGAAAPYRVDAWDPSWGWTRRVAPPFEIEGRPVSQFLEYYAAENGLEIRYRDLDVEEFAATTVLHGSIAGLSPLDALQVVLPGSRLTVEQRDGILQVTTAD